MTRNNAAVYRFNKDYILWTIITSFVLLCVEIGLWFACHHVVKTEVQGYNWVVWVLVFFTIILSTILCSLGILILKRVMRTESKKRATVTMLVVACILSILHLLAVTMFSFWFVLMTAAWHQGFGTPNYKLVTDISLAEWISCAVILIVTISNFIVHKFEK